jgi:heat shock protein HtpX
MLVVTSGLLDTLDPEELEAVLAHELAHLAHHDGAVLAAANAAASVRSFFGEEIRSYDIRAWLFCGIGWAFFGLVSLICFLPVRLLSRYRELGADAAAATLTQKPGSLASALQKLTGAEPVPTTDLRSLAGVEALGIVPRDGRPSRGPAATHPPLETRLERLARVAADLGHPTDEPFGPR